MDIGFFGPTYARSGGAPSFRRNLRVYPPSFMLDKPQLAQTVERGDKIVLYNGHLHELTHALEAGQALVMEMHNEECDRRTHVGVLEFSGEQHGVAYVPAWVLHNVAAEEGTHIRFSLKSLPTLTYVRLQPVDGSFAEAVDNPREVLEEALRSFTVVTEGDELVVHHADVVYGFHVKEVRPPNAQRACSLIGATCEVEFEPAEEADMGDTEPVRDVATTSVPSKAGSGVTETISLSRAPVGAHRPLLPGGSIENEVLGLDSSTYFTVSLPTNTQALGLRLVSAALSQDTAVAAGVVPATRTSASAGSSSSSSGGGIGGTTAASKSSAAAVSRATVSPLLSGIPSSAALASSQITGSRVGRSGSGSGAELLETSGGSRRVAWSSQAAHAEADIYVSCVASKPSRRVSTWHDAHAVSEKRLLLQPSDPFFPTPNEAGSRVFYVGITASGGPIRFSLFTTLEDAASTGATKATPLGMADAAAVASAGASAGAGAGAGAAPIAASPSPDLRGSVSSPSAASMPLPEPAAVPSMASPPSNSVAPAVEPPRLSAGASASPTSSGTASPPASHTLCTNCGATVPNATYMMHSAFCRRNNWKCVHPGCGAVVRITERERHVHCSQPGCTVLLISADDAAKHVRLEHDGMPCDACGELVSNAAYHKHVSTACQYRKAECVYCGVAFPKKDVFAHEDKCGGRTAPCEYCGTLVVRKRIARHHALAHGIGDASLYPPEAATPASPYVARTSGGASASPPAFSLDGGDDFGVMSGLDAALAASTMPSLPLTRANATILGGGTSGGVVVDTTAGAMATAGLPAAAAAAAASPTAVRCPACNVRLPDFDDMQLHLLTDCAARGTDAHRATMTNLFGWVETPSSGGVDGAPTPPGAPVSRSASPMVTEVEGPRPPPAASTMVDVAVTDAQERVSPRSATDAAVVPAHSAPTQPPAMQADTTRGKWKCPQCDALFDVEDDAQVHVMTECPTPWDDAAAALRAISRVGGRRATMDADHYDAHVAFTHGYDDEHDDSDMDGDESISSASHASSPLPMSLGAFAALASLEHSTSETSSTVDAVTAPGIAVTDDGTAWRRAMEVELKCPSCSYIGTTSEGLQMHMLTECMDVDRNMTLLFDAASPPSGA